MTEAQDPTTPQTPQEKLRAFGEALTQNQRRHLRALAQQIKPVVWIGQRGVVDGVIENVEAALVAHELVKVKVLDADMLDDAAIQICEGTGALFVQRIGKMLIFFRANPENPRVQLPRS